MDAVEWIAKQEEARDAALTSHERLMKRIEEESERRRKVSEATEEPAARRTCKWEGCTTDITGTHPRRRYCLEHATEATKQNWERAKQRKRDGLTKPRERTELRGFKPTPRPPASEPDPPAADPPEAPEPAKAPAKKKAARRSAGKEAAKKAARKKAHHKPGPRETATRQAAEGLTLTPGELIDLVVRARQFKRPEEARAFLDGYLAGRRVA